MNTPIAPAIAEAIKSKGGETLGSRPLNKMKKTIAYPEGEAIKLKGGENKEIILLTINCFKKFCLKASTEQADKIYDYYIKMEEIITKYIEK